MKFGSVNMDDRLDHEITASHLDNSHHQKKETEYLLKSVSNVLDLRQSVSVEPAFTIYPSNAHGAFEDILNGKSEDRYRSSFDDHSKDDRNKMVEELTVSNFEGGALALVGSSNDREEMQAALNRRAPPMPCNSRPEPGNRNSFFREDVCREQYVSFEKGIASNDSFPCGDIGIKKNSSPDFSDFFINNQVRDKGLIFRGLVRDERSIELMQHSDTKYFESSIMNSTDSQNSSSEIVSLNAVAESGLGPNSWNAGVNLREWMTAGYHKLSKADSLYIFRQIVEVVDFYHSRGVPLQDLRPTFFMLFPSNKVKYLGRCFQDEVSDGVMDQKHPQCDDFLRRRRLKEKDLYSTFNVRSKKQKFTDNAEYIRWKQPFPLSPESKLRCAAPLTDSITPISWGHDPNQEYKLQNKSIRPWMSFTSQNQFVSMSNQLEDSWYTSPEEFNERICTLSSNIYHLGVLLFELCSSFNSEQAHITAMLDLHHRILPPQFLSEYPREAGFSLWLLHPEPSSRPTTREILESDIVFGGLQEVCAGDESASIDDNDIQLEILSNFLLSLEEQKRKRVSKLAEDIRCLESDIEEVHKRRLLKTPEGVFDEKGSQNEKFSSLSDTNHFRLTKNMNQLESVYMSMRSEIQLPKCENSIHSDQNLLQEKENGCMEVDPVDPLGALFDGLCKYARYDKFEVHSVLRNGDFVNSANVICSLSFDRDEEYFATAGISKKIKIFDFHVLLDDHLDIHYPVVEMVNKSKLSCICWNHYIKNYIASSDYDGAVKLWDAGTGEAFFQYSEHQKRSWSVDFSQVDPTRFASGSDDHTVKLWSISQKNSVDTIRTKANVCCVQFSSNLSHLLAFGSADYKTYCYDLRNSKIPLCVLSGHEKTVSYVKFVDSTTLVTASTDNTLKLWDLNKINATPLSTDASSLTFTGHTNEKNFVGLSIDDGYIACGSETNEVYAYHKSMPMPMSSYKFGSVDAISGKETDDDGGLFVSSVCWRRKSDMIVAANSAGCIKVLRMV